jgi:hypothetical protein
MQETGMAYSSTMKMKAMCSCKHVTQKKEHGMEKKTSEMVKIDGEAY